MKMERNEFLYKTDVNEGNKPIWKLTHRLTMYEWGSVRKYFKFYRDGNVNGWGTINPNVVTEILVGIHSD